MYDRADCFSTGKITSNPTSKAQLIAMFFAISLAIGKADSVIEFMRIWETDFQTTTNYYTSKIKKLVNLLTWDIRNIREERLEDRYIKNQEQSVTIAPDTDSGTDAIETIITSVPSN